MAADESKRPIGVDAPPVPAAPGPEPEHVFSRKIATGQMKQRASGGLRKLASNMAGSYPEMDVHQHLQDAARELDSGRTHSAQRHVNAAIFGLQPLQLRRHGVHDDAGHMRGKAFMQQAHRHLLLIKDIEDVSGSNRAITDQRQQERAMRAAPPPAAVAASWDTHLHVIELVATPHHETAAGRRALQKKGLTAYGTSYPMPNAGYVGKALKAVGRVAPGKRGVLKRAIQKNAKRFGVSLKGTWAEGGAKAMGSEFNLAAYGIEDHYVAELAGDKKYRFKHGWIKLIDGMGSATEAVAGGTGTPLETRPKRKGPGLVRRVENAATRLTDSGLQTKTVGKGTPPHPTPAQARATEIADAGKYAAAMGRNPAKARARAYRAARAKGHSHNRALAIARSIGRTFEAGSAVPPASRGRLGSQVQFASLMEPPPFPVTGARLN